MPAAQDLTTGTATGATGWRRSLGRYTDRRVMLILPLGFASGLPLLLTFSTLSAWFAKAGVSLKTIGAFALVGTPYAFKFLWSPLIDRLPPPIPIGRRRGWGVSIQLALIAATIALGACNPRVDLERMAALAILVAFLSASQDVVIDAYRVEILTPEQQGPGAAMIQTGYRIAMLISGAGALIIAATYGWFAAYATMAALLSVGMMVFIFGPEPAPQTDAIGRSEPGMGRDSRMDRDSGDRAVCGFHAAAGVAGDRDFYCGLQTGRGDGGRDGDAAVHLDRILTEGIAAISKLVGFSRPLSAR